jgi:hypothetical protein
VQTHTASAINALFLIALPGWLYLSSETPSWTILIPVGIGLALLACYPGVRAGSRIVTTLATLITAVTLFALFRPLMSVTGREDTSGLIRVLVMMGSTLFALTLFFRDIVRRRR